MALALSGAGTTMLSDVAGFLAIRGRARKESAHRIDAIGRFR
jgi:hypothetical protein